MPNKTTDMARILAILRDNREHAFLATCDGEQPDLRVMAPFVEDDLTLWFVTLPNARKVGQLKRNPRICLSFVDIPGYAREAKVFGEAVFVTDAGGKTARLEPRHRADPLLPRRPGLPRVHRGPGVRRPHRVARRSGRRAPDVRPARRPRASGPRRNTNPSGTPPRHRAPQTSRSRRDFAAALAYTSPLP